MVSMANDTIRFNDNLMQEVDVSRDAKGIFASMENGIF